MFNLRAAFILMAMIATHQSLALNTNFQLISTEARQAINEQKPSKKSKESKTIEKSKKSKKSKETKKSKTSKSKYQEKLEKAESINLDFGGEKHENEMEAGMLDLIRPELVKTEKCTDTKCMSCSDKSTCWNGDGDNGLSITLDEVPAFKTYVAEVWANCSSSKATWSLSVKKLDFGFISVYIDYKLAMKVKKASKGKLDYKLPVAKGRDAHIRLAFTPDRTPRSQDKKNGKKQEPRANVVLKANGIAQYVDQCMAVKDCLDLLADGSVASFQLRNSNEKQLACFQKHYGPMTAELQAKCEEWTRCLPSEHHTSIKSFLMVAVGGQKDDGSFAEVAPNGAVRRVVAEPSDLEFRVGGSYWPMRRREPKTHDPNSCMDPSSADPESWSCECMDFMQRRCEKFDGDEFECYQDFLCQHPNVCRSWKDDNDCSSDTKATCMTKASKPCHFPFKYGGVTYSKCTTMAHHEHWCATDVDKNGAYISGKWGACQDSCLEDDSLVVLARRQNASTESSGSMDAALNGKCAV